MIALNQRLNAANVSERCEDSYLDCFEILLVEPERQLLDQCDGFKVIQVHLPVASHQRLAVGHARSSKTASPGSSLPSRNSKLAPPPVLM